MTPKQKAQELVNKFSYYTTDWDYLIKAKECALMSVDLVIEVETNIFKGKVYKSYWQYVKQEIEKL